MKKPPLSLVRAVNSVGWQSIIEFLFSIPLYTDANDRGQVVIPKKARELFGINNGDALVILGDEAEGIAIIKADTFEKRLNDIENSMKQEIKE